MSQGSPILLFDITWTGTPQRSQRHFSKIHNAIHIKGHKHMLLTNVSVVEYVFANSRLCQLLSEYIIFHGFYFKNVIEHPRQPRIK